ncbi:MAG TPA: YbjN domain-containing protein [Acidothermaceae bacterium]|nr:YbjN domain-containing protein [Acidothermaceae bacterium]
MSWLARAEIDAVIRATLEEREIVFDQVGESAFVVRLTGTHRLMTVVRLVVGDQSLLIEAFFVGRPDENAQEFYRFLLERNGHMYGVHFAIDAKGDVYLMGRLPLLAVTPDEIDRLLGCVLSYADETFDAALEIGFAESIRREWEWRASRDESAENQPAFARFADPAARGGHDPAVGVHGRHRRGAT